MLIALSVLSVLSVLCRPRTRSSSRHEHSDHPTRDSTDLQDRHAPTRARSSPDSPSFKRPCPLCASLVVTAPWSSSKRTMRPTPSVWTSSSQRPKRPKRVDGPAGGRSSRASSNGTKSSGSSFLLCSVKAGLYTLAEVKVCRETSVSVIREKM